MKQKAAKLHRHSLGTGGGPPLPVTPLSNLEEGLLPPREEMAVTGVEEIGDPLEVRAEISHM